MIVRCPACDGSPGEEIASREMMVGRRDHFVYRRCAACRSLWLEQPPDDLAPFYAGNYCSMSATPGVAGPLARERVALLLRAPARLVRALAKTGRGVPVFSLWFAGLGIRLDDKIGDVGSGAGRLLRTMQAHGFTNLWGFDPFIARDSDEDGIHLRRAEVDDIPDGFPLLMFHHSLEHIRDPVAALTAARQRLTRPGHILVRVPLAGTYAERTYGPDWVGLDPPRHVFVPTEPGMRALAARSGLAVERVFYDSYSLQFWGSEQYRRDIPLQDARSVYQGSQAVFTESEVDAFERQSQLLNARHDGDSAGFLLRPVAPVNSSGRRSSPDDATGEVRVGRAPPDKLREA